MKMIICAIRDSAANAFMRPFYVVSTGQAMRSFQDEVNRSHEENSMFHHPDDFELFELGEWDDSDAGFALLKSPRSLASAKQMRVVKS